MKKIITLSLASLFLILGSISAQDAVVTEKEGIKLKPTIALHGRIQYDFEFLSRTLPDADEDYSFQGQEFRRVYLSGAGTIYKNIKYKVQFEFAGSQIGYRDVYIQFAKLPYIGGNLSFGSMAEATGLDMATSSKYLSFMERSMMTNTQNFRWNSGVHYSNFGILDGHLGLQMSYTFNGTNNQGFDSSSLKFTSGAFLDKEIGDRGHFVTRLTSPININKDKHQMIHLGVNYEYRKRTEDPSDYTLKFRPGNHMGSKTSVSFTDLETQSDIGFEFAGIFGPLTIAGEYEIAGYQTTEDSYTVSGYYADITYFLFGGRRSYKKGAFSRVKPTSNFCIKEGGYGALELGIRYDVMDYSNVITDGNTDKVSNIILGLNYYLNSHTRLMYNYVITDYNDTNNTNNLNANLLRLQVDF